MAKVSDVIDVEKDEVTAPTTSLPEHAGSSSRDAIRDAVMAETVEAISSGTDDTTEETEDQVIARLAEKEELTAEDLREVAGKDAEGLTDEELLAKYKEIEAQSDFKLPFPIYDANGNKIEDVSKLTVEDLLSGKVQLGYTAMGKEQRKALNDLMRVAANGHYNESKMTTLTSERAQAYKQLQDLKKEHEEWGKDRGIWNQVLTAYVNGNAKPLEVLINKFMAELGKVAPSIDVSCVPDAALYEAGQQYFIQNILPVTNKLAQDYGADASEVAQAALQLIDAEPTELLTKEKVEAIIQYELPALLEQNGYSSNGTSEVAQPSGNEALVAKLESMEKELLALKAGQSNAATDRVRSRNRNAPPAGGGGVNNAGESMPNFKNRNEMKAYLRGEIE